MPGDPTDGSAEAVEARKTALRVTALRARRDLDLGERRRAAEAATARLERLAELRRARTILLYAAMADEIDPAGLIAPLTQRGVRTLFPRVVDERLELVAAADLLALRLGHRGIREPVGPAVDVSAVDAAIVPGVAFDVAGGRIGQGGGHYDRLLPELADDCLRIGLCFACQVVPHVPRAAHDQPVDVVVTERATYRAPANEP